MTILLSRAVPRAQLVAVHAPLGQVECRARPAAGWSRAGGNRREAVSDAENQRARWGLDARGRN